MTNVKTQMPNAKNKTDLITKTRNFESAIQTVGKNMKDYNKLDLNSPLINFRRRWPTLGGQKLPPSPFRPANGYGGQDGG